MASSVETGKEVEKEAEKGVQFEELDKTEFGWLHIKAVLVAGIG